MSNHPRGERNRALVVVRRLLRFRLPLPRAALLCAVSAAVPHAASAATPYRVLNHEAIQIESQALGGGRQHLQLVAFGKQFELSLQPNESIRHAVPSGRSDIEPLEGTVDGQSGSWVRITRTRAGWRGMIFDGQELYAIEPVGDLGEALVQPHSDSPTAPVMYRLADAIMTVGTGFCATLDAEGNPVGGVGSNGATPDASTPDHPSALKVFKAIASDLSNTALGYPTKRLMTGIVADY